MEVQNCIPWADFPAGVDRYNHMNFLQMIMEQISMIRKSQNSTESTQPVPSTDGGVYEIKIKECLDDQWKGWFEGMNLKNVANSKLRQQCTLIIGPIADQPALHGLLAKIRDLNLTLISVRNIAPKESASQDLFHLGGEDG